MVPGVREIHDADLVHVSANAGVVRNFAEYTDTVKKHLVEHLGPIMVDTAAVMRSFGDSMRPWLDELDREQRHMWNQVKRRQRRRTSRRR